MKNNHTVRKGLKLRCKWQEGISCQREVRGTQPKSGAAHRATVTVTLRGRDHCLRQCLQSQRLRTRGSQLTAGLGHLNLSYIARLKQPGPSSLTLMRLLSLHTWFLLLT